MKAFRVRVDESRCIGAGRCALTAPGIFDQREDGMVILLDTAPAPQLRAAVRRAVDLCPSEAIVIEEDAP